MSPPAAATDGGAGPDGLRGAGGLRDAADPRFAPAVELAALCCRTASAALVTIDDTEQLLCKAQWGLPEAARLKVADVSRRALWLQETVVFPVDAPVGAGPFWAAAPICLPNTDCWVGALVVLDDSATAPNPAEVKCLLELLATQVAHLMNANVCAGGELQRMNLFVAKVSHELRTPLNGILGCAALLQSRLGSSADAETSEMLRHISTSAEHNLQTVNQILDFAKLDAGRVELERLPFDLRECVEEAMAMLPVDRKPRDVELGYEMAEDAEVVGDPHRLKQVLLNLLSNALKFTTQGSVMLSVQLRPDTDPGSTGLGCVQFTVRDTGPGVSPDAMQLLFEPYLQGSASVTRTHGGTGLGLAISRMLAEAMGGRLWLESTVGEGSAFHFTAAVPLRPTPARGFPGGSVLLVDDRPARTTLLQRHLESLSLKVHHIPSLSKADLPPGCDLVVVAGPPGGPLPTWPVPWVLVADPAAGEASPRAGGGPPAFVLPAVVSQRQLRRRLAALWPARMPPPPPLLAAATTLWENTRELAGLKVLVADDVKVNQVVLQGFLKRFECVVDVHSNGVEAVEAIIAHSYDVAILDLQMPVLDGLAAARQVRALPHVPYLVAASSTPGELVHSQCLDVGFDAFLQKPIRFDELCQVLLDAKRTPVLTAARSPTVASPPSGLEEDFGQTPAVATPLFKLLHQPVCAFAGRTFAATPPSPRETGPLANRRGFHLKLLSRMRNVKPPAPTPPSTITPTQAPTQTPPMAAVRSTSAVRKSPAPPKSPLFRRPSRLFSIVCPDPTVPI